MLSWRKRILVPFIILISSTGSLRADVTSFMVDRDLTTLGLLDTPDSRSNLERQDFVKLGVMPAPLMLTSNELHQLEPYAKKLWNRDYEYHLLPRQIRAETAELAKLAPGNPKYDAEKKKLAQDELMLNGNGKKPGQPGYLPPQKARRDLAIRQYNQRVQDIENERTMEGLKEAAKIFRTKEAKGTCTDVGAAVEGTLEPIPQLTPILDIASLSIQGTQKIEDLQVMPEKLIVPAQPPVTASAAVPVSVPVVVPAPKSVAPQASKQVPPPPSPSTLPAVARSTVPKFDIANLSHIDLPASEFVLEGTSPVANGPVNLVLRASAGNTAGSIFTANADQTGHFAIHGYVKEGPGNYSAEVNYVPAGKDPSSFSGLLKNFTITNQDQNPDARYRFPSNLVQSDAPQIVALANQIVTKAGADTDAKKAKAIYDWIANNITYDDATYQKAKTVDDWLNSHPGYAMADYQKVLNAAAIPPIDSLSVLKSGKSICYGYSMLYAALARAAGLEARMVNGPVTFATMNHEWNQVFIGGNWVMLDATGGATGKAAGFTPDDFDPKQASTLAQYDIAQSQVEKY